MQTFTADDAQRKPVNKHENDNTQRLAQYFPLQQSVVK
jgi:hypothetical protein